MNKVTEYPMSAHVRQLETWMNNRWLLPYSEEELGPPKGLILLMAVFQENKLKVGPVLDFCKLNEYIDAYMAHADVCAQKLREWEKEGLQRVDAQSPKGCICKCVCTNPCGHTRQLSLKERGTAYCPWVFNLM